MGDRFQRLEINAEATPADLQERRSRLKAKRQPANTTRAYASDWRHFSDWCAERAYQALPASAHTLELYLIAFMEELKHSTLERHLAAIGKKHQEEGFQHQISAQNVRETLGAIRREQIADPDGFGLKVQRTPILLDQLRCMIEHLPLETLSGKRDRALLLIGWAAALRRSEVSALNVADIEIVEAGLVVTVRQSKTDQKGEGMRKGIPRGKNEATCPQRAYKEWLTESGIKKGAVFRYIDRHGHLHAQRISGDAVSEVVKRSVARIGEDPDLYGGHSLRAGLITEVAKQGAQEWEIASLTGHRSMRQLRVYVRPATLFDINPLNRTDM